MLKKLRTKGMKSDSTAHQYLMYIGVEGQKTIVRVCMKDLQKRLHKTQLLTPERSLMCFNVNPLNAKLNPICHLLVLLGAHHILHVSRVRVK